MHRSWHVAIVRCEPTLGASAARLAYRPLPPQVEQIAGAQVCAIPAQVHAVASTRPPPLQVGHGPQLLVVVLVVVIASSCAELVAGHPRPAICTARWAKREWCA